MKILIVHNYYQQAGGEDEVFNTEASLLKTKVLRYCATPFITTLLQT